MVNNEIRTIGIFNPRKLCPKSRNPGYAIKFSNKSKSNLPAGCVSGAGGIYDPYFKKLLEGST
jgi:hypothetical protein